MQQKNWLKFMQPKSVDLPILTNITEGVRSIFDKLISLEVFWQFWPTHVSGGVLSIIHNIWALQLSNLFPFHKLFSFLYFCSHPCRFFLLLDQIFYFFASLEVPAHCQHWLWLWHSYLNVCGTEINEEWFANQFLFTKKDSWGQKMKEFLHLSYLVRWERNNFRVHFSPHLRS